MQSFKSFMLDESSNLSGRDIEKALHTSGEDLTAKVLKSSYKGKSSDGKHHVYHVHFEDDHVDSGVTKAKVYVSKNAKGEHVAEF